MEIHPIALLKTFVNSGVHGVVWPKCVYAVALFGQNGKFVTRNDDGEAHAEEKVTEYFECLLANGRHDFQRIQLFLTRSPCDKCSQGLLDFLHRVWCRHGLYLEIEVVFAAFHMVGRPSCVVNQDCRNHRLPPFEEHWAQVEGLRKLFQTKGVFLHPFTGPDWHRLKTALGQPDFDCSSREKEDYFLWQDFQQLMGALPTFHGACYPPPLMSRFQDYQQPTVYPPPHQPAHQPSTYSLPYNTCHGYYPDDRLPAAHGMPFAR